MHPHVLLLCFSTRRSSWIEPPRLLRLIQSVFTTKLRCLDQRCLSTDTWDSWDTWDTGTAAQIPVIFTVSLTWLPQENTTDEPIRGLIVSDTAGLCLSWPMEQLSMLTTTFLSPELSLYCRHIRQNVPPPGVNTSNLWGTPSEHDLFGVSDTACKWTVSDYLYVWEMNQNLRASVVLELSEWMWTTSDEHFLHVQSKRLLLTCRPPESGPGSSEAQFDFCTENPQIDTSVVVWPELQQWLLHQRGLSSCGGRVEAAAHSEVPVLLSQLHHSGSSIADWPQTFHPRSMTQSVKTLCLHEPSWGSLICFSFFWSVSEESAVIVTL